MSNEKQYTRIKDVMAKQLETIEGMATVSEAIRIMKEKNYGALIIDKRDEGDEYGFITVQEIAQEVIEKNLSADRVNVYEIMKKPVLTMHCDMNIRYAIRLLDQVNQQRALVIDNGKAIGVVTMYDMVIHYLDK